MLPVTELHCSRKGIGKGHITAVSRQRGARQQQHGPHIMCNTGLLVWTKIGRNIAAMLAAKDTTEVRKAVESTKTRHEQRQNASCLPNFM